MLKWNVGSVVIMAGGRGSDGERWGFNIISESGQPLVSFMYNTSADADKAAKLAKSIVEIRSHP
jgi:hypothetical protein